MARRALTLLELLLALSLLLALGALVLPVAVQSLGERAFESNTEIIRDQLLLACAHAGAANRPVEVFYDPDPPRIEARYFQVDVAQDRSPKYRRAPRGAVQARWDTVDAGPARELEPELASDTADPIVESWAENPLPAGFSLTGQPPGPAGAPAATAAPRDTQPRPMRLAIFMPDGSALLCRPVWIGDEHGRQAKLTINPWTGLGSLERLAAGDETGLGAAKEKDLPEGNQP
jgi:hypothetical protein